MQLKFTKISQSNWTKEATWSIDCDGKRVGLVQRFDDGIYSVGGMRGEQVTSTAYTLREAKEEATAFWASK